MIKTLSEVNETLDMWVKV